ncbi:MAG: CehA/McbA family metallohydrolase [Chloroflexi bacterium]|nr:CehA/McbA family metallohydrolase [Chloroflexota bacterium]
MPDKPYVPVDIERHRNVPASALARDGREPATGAQQFRGLPFTIGERETAFIGLGPGLSSDRVVIPVDQTAFSVLFAHRLVASRILEGGPVGIECAEYVFCLADGSRHRVAIRERFEIGDILSWGQRPFLAVTDEQDRLQARWRGTWAHAGFRQTESIQGFPRDYYLWRWRNPEPSVPLHAIELEPRASQVIVAAITLGLVDEDPLRHSGAVPVRLDLKSADLMARPLDVGPNDLMLEVDRGVAGYVYPLSRWSAEAFLADGFAGWGEPVNGTSSPAYAQVAAVPSSILQIKLDDDTAVDSVEWQAVLERRSVETDRVRVTLVEDGRNWVETVVLDDTTGQPVPCRVHFRSVDGVPYQPHGHHAHVGSNQDTWHRDVGGDLRLGQLSYAYIDGRCQGWLPRGEVLVDVARGFEYEPLRTRVRIEPGQQRLELRLRRWTDMNAQRWYSGDTHVHFLSTHGSLREAQAEDLNVVNLLQSQWGSLFTNTEDFIGEPVSSRDGRTVVWTNQENRQHLLGHMILLGLRTPVYPWCSDGPSEADLGSTLDTTLAAWADACHGQGGTVILPHFPNPNGEPAALVATGRVDAVEMIMHAPFNHLEYYRYLNSGYKLPLVGGTDKMSSEVAVGQYRTYVRLGAGEEFTYASWCRNLQLGRTFLSGGPLLELSVEGAEIGDTLRLAAGGATVSVSAGARSVLPIHTLQLVHNGRVVAQSDDTAGARALTLRAEVKIDGHGWLCARAGGPNYEPVAHHDVWRRGVFAHTSPVYVAVGDDWTMADRDGLQYMLTLVEGGLAYVRDMAPQRPAERVRHHHGEADHQGFLERPFLEAQAALRARLGRQTTR